MTEQERAVITAAMAWLKGWKAQQGPRAVVTPDSPLRPLQDAVEALDESAPGPRTDQARPMTWGTVPAGWYVKAPDGQWYEVLKTRFDRGIGQAVTLAIGKGMSKDRDPAGPVTACPGPPNATDDALEALGFPPILEDGS